MLPCRCACHCCQCSEPPNTALRRMLCGTPPMRPHLLASSTTRIAIMRRCSIDMKLECSLHPGRKQGSCWLRVGPPVSIATRGQGHHATPGKDRDPPWPRCTRARQRSFLPRSARPWRRTCPNPAAALQLKLGVPFPCPEMTFLGDKPLKTTLGTPNSQRAAEDDLAHRVGHAPQHLLVVQVHPVQLQGQQACARRFSIREAEGSLFTSWYRSTQSSCNQGAAGMRMRVQRREAEEHLLVKRSTRSSCSQRAGLSTLRTSV